MKDETAELLAQLEGEQYCYLTTTGRVSGRPHEIEIWFRTRGSHIYLMAGNDTSDWVLNLMKDPNVTVRISRRHFLGIARVVKDEQEEMFARHLLAKKYHEWENGQELSNWARTALVVGIEVHPIP